MLRLFMLIVAAGCTSPPTRPDGVPDGAVYSGGPERGYWLSCSPDGQLYNCQVFHRDGALYQSGSFSTLAELPACYPGFVLADYRYGGEFLIPEMVGFENQDLNLASVEGANLESEISQRFVEAYGLSPSVVQIALRDECGNGTFEAHFRDSSHIIRGRIWARRIIQIWNPAADHPEETEPNILPENEEAGRKAR